jgi:hypothetical protein
MFASFSFISFHFGCGESGQNALFSGAFVGQFVLTFFYHSS